MLMITTLRNAFWGRQTAKPTEPTQEQPTFLDRLDTFVPLPPVPVSSLDILAPRFAAPAPSLETFGPQPPAPASIQLGSSGGGEAEETIFAAQSGDDHWRDNFHRRDLLKSGLCGASGTDVQGYQHRPIRGALVLLSAMP